jgi:hypothetical protein
MLLDLGVKSGDVVTIKLTSGEELVAHLVEERDAFLKVARPLVLTGGQQGIGMVPYLFTVDPERTVKINKATVVVLEPSDKEAASQYTKATTGIII